MQKSAYQLSVSDCGSDVCSSDLCNLDCDNETGLALLGNSWSPERNRPCFYSWSSAVCSNLVACTCSIFCPPVDILPVSAEIKSRDRYPAASAKLLADPPIAACASAAKSISPVRRCSTNSDTTDRKAGSKTARKSAV